MKKEKKPLLTVFTKYPGRSIRPVEPTGNGRIRHRIAPEFIGFPIKSGRNPTEFHRIPN